MKSARNASPRYCLHKRSGNAYVKLNGRQVYLGEHGSAESWSKYRRVLAEWDANGKKLPEVAGADTLTVADLADSYLEHCEVYYRHVADGTPTHEIDNVVLSLAPLLDLYGTTLARDFGIAQLKVVRDRMIKADLCRTTTNSRISRIVRMFAWGAGEEKVDPGVAGALRAVRALPFGRTTAREAPPKRIITRADIDAVLPHLRPQLRALIEVMWLTAMRVGEAVQLRGRHVDMSGPTWLFDPPLAKNRHRGKDCRIDLGIKAQEILAPFVQLDPDRYWFRPADEEAHRQRDRRARRKTPLWPSHLRSLELRRAARTPRVLGDQYDSRAVAHALRRACTAAKVDAFSPHRIRHASLSNIRKQFGREAAGAIGGHSSVAMTEHYTADARRSTAREVMLKLG